MPGRAFNVIPVIVKHPGVIVLFTDNAIKYYCAVESIKLINHTISIQNNSECHQCSTLDVKKLNHHTFGTSL